jgi:hypothetical protein
MVEIAPFGMVLQKLPSIPGFLEWVKDGNLGQIDWSSGGHGGLGKIEV